MSEVKDKELLMAKIKLVMILLIFGVPMLVAMIMARLSDHGLPDFVGTTNNGEFVVPVVVLEPFELTTPDNEMLNNELFNEFWTLTYVSEDGCSEQCQQQIYAMRQIRLMLGREAMRVNRLFVHRNLSEAELQSIGQHFPEMLVGTAGPETLSALKKQLIGESRDSGLYLIDPVGHLMMFFPSDMNPRLIYKDLKKLLKATKS